MTKGKSIPAASKKTAEEQVYDEMKILAEAELNRVRSELEATKEELVAVRTESEVLGMLKKIEHDQAYNQILKYTALARLKEHKGYRKGGMTWEQFCAAIGESDRTVDRVLSDLRPLFDAFSANLSGLPLFDGLNFNKIRYLGRSISDKMAEIEDGTLVIDGVKVPLLPENAEEIETLIDNLKETHRQEKSTLEKKVDRLERSIENAIKEETHSLLVEKEALVKENKRLKAFDPQDKDRTWSIEQAKEIEKACQTFVICCSKFIVDERIEDDRHLQALVEKHLTEATAMLHDLRRRFDEQFGFYSCP